MWFASISLWVSPCSFIASCVQACSRSHSKWWYKFINTLGFPNTFSSKIVIRVSLIWIFLTSHHQYGVFRDLVREWVQRLLRDLYIESLASFSFMVVSMKVLLPPFLSPWQLAQKWGTFHNKWGFNLMRKVPVLLQGLGFNQFIYLKNRNQVIYTYCGEFHFYITKNKKKRWILQ